MFKGVQSILASYLATSATVKPGPTISPLLGRAFPAPANLASDSGFQGALETFDAALSATLSKTSAGQNTSFSISVFSASDPRLLYERHHTTDLVAGATSGTNEIDGDSIYRICSNSKLLTVYTFLAQDGDRHLNDPITDYVPELLEEKAHTIAVSSNWEEITLGELASHLSGIARDYGLNDFTVNEYEMMIGYPRLRSLLPPLSTTDRPVCGYLDGSGTYITCDQSTFASGVANAAAIFPTSYTPTYCNDGYVLFAMALERIKNDSFENMFVQSLLEPLGLEHSSYSVPSASKRSYGVIPGNSTKCGWDSELGAFSPAGANYMSLNDISTLGRSILNSDLLPKAQTRRWLKPRSLLTDVSKAVGMPWEIERIQLGGRTVDLYMKDGDWNVYNTRLVLVPDYHLGFSILTASDSASIKRNAGLQVISSVSGEMVKTLLPALENVARDKTKRAFAGRYSSSSDGVAHSITLEVDSQPALKLTEWIYNGTDILKELGRPFVERDQAFDFRLQPNELYEGNEVGFTGIFGGNPWEIVDLFRYGNVGLEQFVFEVDDSGVAISVQSKGLRDTLKKT